MLLHWPAVPPEFAKLVFRLSGTLALVNASERKPGEVSSFGQGVALIDAVVRHERSGRLGLSVSRLADLTGIERSRASRLTQELLELGMLEKASDGRLRAGPGYFALGASRQDAWLRASRQELRGLASRYKASLRILAADGSLAVLLRFESGLGAPDSAIRPGMVTPIWSTGGGRALLWEMNDDEIVDLLKDSRFIGIGGPNAVKSSTEVANRVRCDRSRGIVEAVEEFEYGVVELASPICVNHDVIASVSAACRIEDAEARDGLARELPLLAHRLGDIAGRSRDPAKQ